MSINEQILLAANSYHTPFLDNLMMMYSYKWTWVPLYAACLAMLIWKYGWVRALYYLLFIALSVTAADQICASILRPMLHSMRPSNPDNPFSQFVTIVHGYRSGKYGMPSCHAANSFAFISAYIIFVRSQWITIVLPIWGLFICYTRLYLGVHYPADLLVGSCIGAAIGSLIAIGALKLEKKMQNIRRLSGYRTFHISIPNPVGPYSITMPLAPIAIPMAVLIITILTAAYLSL